MSDEEGGVVIPTKHGRLRKQSESHNGLLPESATPLPERCSRSQTRQKNAFPDKRKKSSTIGSKATTDGELHLGRTRSRTRQPKDMHTQVQSDQRPAREMCKADDPQRERRARSRTRQSSITTKGKKSRDEVASSDTESSAHRRRTQSRTRQSHVADTGKYKSMSQASENELDGSQHKVKPKTNMTSRSSSRSRSRSSTRSELKRGKSREMD